MSPKAMKDILFDLRSDHVAGLRSGRVAICSIRREVLAAALESARSRDDHLLVEATANQVNQFGGYSGMTPAAFAAYMRQLAASVGFPRSRVLLGADHLGPYVWRDESAERAMQKALELVRQCVYAGFIKIHLDTGFGCIDDPQPELPPETAAERAVTLCRAAETAAELIPGNDSRPHYVIGIEVPPPGGALEASGPPEVTSVEKLQGLLQLYEARFKAARLESAWNRIMAVVVQPGIEFGDQLVAHYRSQSARALSLFYDRLPTHMIYEVHSADYQTSDNLAQMVADHFILLKVGPCLTHSFREAVFELARIESERLARRRSVKLSSIREVLETVMLENPSDWQSHYRGTEEHLRFLRSHSKRDRIRYYWDHPAVANALQLLMANLKSSWSPTWAEVHRPDASSPRPSDQPPDDPAALIRQRIQSTLDPYLNACA